jgi:hypothetical protein
MNFNERYLMFLVKIIKKTSMSSYANLQTLNRNVSLFPFEAEIFREFCDIKNIYTKIHTHAFHELKKCLFDFKRCEVMKIKEPSRK